MKQVTGEQETFTQLMFMVDRKMTPLECHTILSHDFEHP